ncbi:MAG: ATP-binding protein [Pseudomonadaceae bacterium]|nr:ATP-binding protein [Pseudomonadaceae bacterium]
MIDFDSSGFMPHGHCYLWEPGILWTHVVSDAIVATAYFSIPIALATYVYRRSLKDRLGLGVIAMFITFILFCGTTHLISIWTVWNPDYVVEAAFKAATALASIGTAIALWPLLPKALAIPAPAELSAANAALAEANANLEQKVERRTADLSQRSRDLERSNLELAEFAYVASHDLQAPLRHLISYSDILKVELAGVAISAEASESLAYIGQSGRRMRQLVSELLEFSRIESETEIEQTPATIRGLAEQALAITAPIAAEAGALIDNELGSERVVVNENMIVRLLTNLLHNGILYRRQGVIPKLTLSSEVDSERVTVCVEDNGVGIDEAHYERAFAVFQRLDVEREGTGLGLSICRKIVHLHGGEIWLDSEPDRGTRVYFTLPIA